MKFNSDQFEFNPIVPFRFMTEQKEKMFAELRKLRYDIGIKRVLLIFPEWNSEAKTDRCIGAFEKFGDLLAEVKGELAGDGIDIGWWCAPTLSIGSGNTIGKENPHDFQKFVGINGAVSPNANCPSDSNFRSFYAQCLKAVVERGHPSVIFFEDDYEISNHGIVQFGCFCPLHIARFSERIGEKLTREELEIIFRKGDETSARYRRIWAELMRESLVELSAELRNAVDQVEPGTRMALCQPGTCDFDGDMTAPVAKALAGSTRPFVRLWGSDYNSDRADNFPTLTFHLFYSRHALGNDFELIHESDPYPHTGFFFSAAKLRALIALSMLYRLDGSLLYITQYTDGPLEEKAYCSMVKESRNYFSELRKASEGFLAVGPRILYHPYSHVHREIIGNNAPISAFSGWANFAWAQVLGKFGIPYTVVEGNEPVLACGEDILELTHEEILKLLGKGLFLDGLAAKYLCRAGYGEYLGLETEEFSEEDIVDITNERFTENNIWKDNTEGTYSYFVDAAFGIQNHRGTFRLKPKAGCRVLSELINDDGEVVSPASVLFKNRLGGRIAVLAYNLEYNHTASVLNYKRKEQVRGIIEWLSGKNLPVYVSAAPSVFAAAFESAASDDKLAAVFNLSLDEMKKIELIVDKTWKKDNLFYLNVDGLWEKAEAVQWETMPDDKFKVMVNIICSTLKPMVFMFSNFH